MWMLSWVLLAQQHKAHKAKHMARQTKLSTNLHVLQAGFGLAFCIGAVMCSVVGATTIATGEIPVAYAPAFSNAECFQVQRHVL